MRRRAFLAAAAGATLAPAIARSQQSRVPVVGYLALTSPGPFAPLLAAFHRGLAETGFVEGRDVAIEYRWAEGRSDRLPELALDLVARKVDLISTHGGAFVALAAKEATTTIPIVFETGIDPVAVGLVASMARPGGNLTGVAILTADPEHLSV
jgi:putative ABC transport system substrate-binding protein